MKKIHKYIKYITLSVMLLFLSYFSTFAQWVNHWEEANIPIDFKSLQQGDAYLDVYFLPSNNNYGWICGNRSRVLRTTDAGKTWTGVFLSTNRIYQLESIHFVNERVGFCSGPDNTFKQSSSVLFKTTDGGKTWSDITPPNFSSQMWGLYFLNENEGIVIGDGCGNRQQFFRTTNGGDSWINSTRNIQGSKMSDAILYSNDSLGYAVGSGVVWRTLDGGFNWDPFFSTKGEDWHEELTNIGSSFLLPVSSGCNGNSEVAGGIKFTLDTGKTWNNYQTPAAMYGSYLINGSTGWAAGLNNSVYFTCNGGANWDRIVCGIQNANLDDIRFLDDTTGWVVGSKIYYTKNIMPQSKIIVMDTTEFCAGDEVVLKQDAIFKNYRWSTCNFNPQISIRNDGDYFLHGYENPCDTGKVYKFPTIMHPLPEYTIARDKNTPICEGDTVIISVNKKYPKYLWSTGDTTQSIKVTISGSYFVTVTDSNNCKNSSSFDIIFNKVPETQILSNGKTNLCEGDSLLISSEGTFAKYKWEDNNTGEILSTEKSLWIYNTKKLKLTVENEAGCSFTTKESVFEFRKDTNQFVLNIKDNPLQFENQVSSIITCKNFEIFNRSNERAIIDNIYLRDKIYFSTPNLNFPYIIEAKSSAEIEVCFMSNQVGKFNDEIIINDTCSNHSILLKAEVMSLELEGVTRCKIPWQSKTIEVTSNIAHIETNIPFPNPAEDIVKIEYFTICSENELKVKAQIFDILGNERSKGNNISVENRKYSTFTTQFGYSEFNLESLEAGLYFLKINENVYPIVVSKSK